MSAEQLLSNELQISSRCSIGDATCCNGGIQFNVHVKRNLTITSITFGTYENCDWAIYISGNPYERTITSGWTQVAKGRSRGARKKPQEVTFDKPLRVAAAQVLGMYIYGNNSRGILFEDSSIGYITEDDFLRIESGCAMRRNLFESQENHGEYEFVGNIGYVIDTPDGGMSGFIY